MVAALGILAVVLSLIGSIVMRWHCVRPSWRRHFDETFGCEPGHVRDRDLD